MQRLRSLRNYGESKYGNRTTRVYQQTFASKKEAERYLELRAMQNAGKIENLTTQTPFELIPPLKDDSGKVIERAVTYVADFVYFKDGKIVVEDVKGYKGGGAYAVFKIKKKLMRWLKDIEVKEV